MPKLKLNLITAGKDKTLIAWDFDARLFKKLAFLSKPIFEKHGVKIKPPAAEWPHISAVYVLAPDMNDQERDKFALVADVVKPKFIFKQLAMFVGATSDFFSVEYKVPDQFQKFMTFAEEVCGKERVQRFKEDRPHVSIWELSKEEAKKVTPEVLAEIKEAVWKYLQPFIPSRLSFWDDFQISKIEQLSTLFMGNSFKEKVRAVYRVCEN